MAIAAKANLARVSSTAKVPAFTPMAIAIKVNSSTARNTGKVLIYMQIERK
jgi:hypothetical protein